MYYRRRKNKKRLIVLVSSILMFIALGYGYVSNDKPLEKPGELGNKISEEDIVKDEEDISDLINNTKEVDNQGIEKEGNEKEEAEDNQISTTIVTENTEIVFDTYYNQTGEINRNSIKVPTPIIGMTLSEFRDYIESNYSDWRIKNISTKSVVLYKEKNSLMPNTYLIKNNEGYITIYKVNDDGEIEIFDETDISVNNLPNTDRTKLNKGIYVKTLEEVESLIEDYSS